MKRSEVNELKTLLERLDDSYNVNTGGCFYVAYLVAKNLEALGISYEVIEWKEPDNGEMFHVSIRINGTDVNPAYEEYNGISELSRHKTSYALMRLNAREEILMICIKGGIKT